MSRDVWRDYPGDPPEGDEYGEDWDAIIAELKRRHYGGNRDCFEIYSESGKDADLCGGCCGIAEIPFIDDEKLRFIVKGHVTFCWEDNEHSEEGNKLAQEVAFDTDSITDADSEGWYASFTEEVTVPIALNNARDNISVKRTVNRIISAYRKAIRPHLDEWGAVNDDYNKLYEEYPPVSEER